MMGNDKNKREQLRQEFNEHMRTMPYETTPAQRLMREEMGQPAKLDAVLTEAFGALAAEDARVREIALNVISSDHTLRLNMREWEAVQALVELAVHEGFVLGFNYEDEEPLTSR